MTMALYKFTYLLTYLMFNGIFSTNRQYRATGIWDIPCTARQDTY